MNKVTQTSTASLANLIIPATPTQYADAMYPGDGEYDASTSSSVAITPSLSIPTLGLASNANPSFYGTSITLTATLKPFSVGGATTNGEPVTFYSGGTSIGRGTLASGVAQPKIATLPVGTNTLTATYPGDANFIPAASNAVAQRITTDSAHVPTYTVTVNTDPAVGLGSKCMGSVSTQCSLRDALAASVLSGEGNILFDPTVFAATQPVSARTIRLNTTLIVPSNTTIIGPTMGSGASLVQLVTLTPLNDSAFTINKGITHVAATGLAISGGQYNIEFFSGAGFNNDGALTVTNTSITDNIFFDGGGSGIFNGPDGALTLSQCNVSSNVSYDGDDGGGIENVGTLVISDSTISKNYIQNASGAGLANAGTATLTNTTVDGNRIIAYGNGGGVVNTGKLTIAGSSISGNGAPELGNGSGIFTSGMLVIGSTPSSVATATYTIAPPRAPAPTSMTPKASPRTDLP